MRYFYDPTISNDTLHHTLPQEESKHIVRVLRMSAGDDLAILNGKGDLYHCIISGTEGKLVKVDITKCEHYEEEKPIHIAIAATKNADRIEWFLEKATELGLTELTFISCKNSERSRVKIDRLIKKAISAMKQSRRAYLPIIHETIAIKSFIQSHPNGLIAHCYDEQKQHFNKVYHTENCPILIGPEGDFTLEEVDLALQYGYKNITLGKTRLRTETAALYAVTLAKTINETEH